LGDVADTLIALAREREEAWLAKHGKNVYADRDLDMEALEELADAYNYLRERGRILLAIDVACAGEKLMACMGAERQGLRQRP
jgi:hypothetical protein